MLLEHEGKPLQEHPFNSVLYASCAEDTFNFLGRDSEIRNVGMTILGMVLTLLVVNIASADIFDEGGANEFTIDFVNISGDASSANGTNISSGSPGDSWYRTFTDPGNDYRMGTYEITNDQFAMFTANSPYWTGADVPANQVSWYEGAQFVNFLNTSTGNPAAYKFSGSTFSVWESGDAGYDADNPYRNSNAYYFLPTEDEWVKAAYWNGTSLQTYATKAGESLTQGDGTSGTGWNYRGIDGYATDPYGPWDVGSGSEELNGTFDMMGNLWEWKESPYSSGDYLPGSYRGIRDGSYSNYAIYLSSSTRNSSNPYVESNYLGFRVASVPEPATLLFLGLGGLMLRRKK